MSTAFRSVTLVALAGLLAACADSGAPSIRSQVTLRVASRPATGTPLAALVGETDTIASPEDTIILDQVQIVLRDIRFKRINDDVCEGENNDSADLRALNSDDGENDACEEVNAGPFLLDVPLTPGTEKQFSVALDTGTFDEIRFKIHKPEDDGSDPRDIQFLLDHPEFAKVSIRVTGAFNGTPFTFESDLDEEQERALVPPLAVADSMQNVDVTLLVDLDTWFRDGASLVDPASALKGGPNEELVTNNIRASFRAFRDDDGDGEDDDGGQDD